MQRIVEAPAQDLLTARQCADWLNIGQSQFRELVREGQFPAPIQIGRRKCQRWLWLDAFCFAYLKSTHRRGGEGAAEPPPGRRRGG